MTTPPTPAAPGHARDRRSSPEASGKAVAWLIVPMVLSLVWEVDGALSVQRADRVGVRHDVHALRHVLHAGLGVDAAAWRPHPHRLCTTGSWSPRTRARVDLACYLVFFFPAIAIFGWLGWEYFWKSFQQNERIVTCPWLPIVWPFKFVMPASAVLLLLQGVSELIKCWGRAFGPATATTRQPTMRGRDMSADVPPRARARPRGSARSPQRASAGV